MCGLIGYLGNSSAVPVLVEGLKKLEYRGYDSAGVAVVEDQRIVVKKTAGEVANLATAVTEMSDKSSLGIAHTRWATHGEANAVNAHPHMDAHSAIALVHNGIIENFSTIRSFLKSKGIVFQSETDTEALAQLIGYFYQQESDFSTAVIKALKEVEGAYGIAVLCKDKPDCMIVARKGSPLIIGVGTSEYIVASDVNAIAALTQRVIYLDDGEVAQITPDGVSITTLDSKPVEKEMAELDLELDEIELGDFPNYMLKEVYEQPEAISNALAGRIDFERGEVTLSGLKSLERELARFRQIVILGCGTAWHSGLIARYLFEEWARIPTRVEYASEFRYRNPLVEPGTLALVISQSGETADTLAALREVKRRGATAFGVVNSVGSTISRETDAGVYLHAGPEVGVASTKAFTAQLAVLTLIALDLGSRRHLSSERATAIMTEMGSLPEKISACLQLSSSIKKIVERFVVRENWLYLGRGVNFPVALEGALKLKEISYIHAEGMPAAEMKHGPIALIDKGMPVVFVAPRDHSYEKVLSNMEEVKGRGGELIVITNHDDERLNRLTDNVIPVPHINPYLSPILTSIPLQLIAYWAATLRGLNVDKPRNLAKSVTVE